LEDDRFIESRKRVLHKSRKKVVDATPISSAVRLCNHTHQKWKINGRHITNNSAKNPQTNVRRLCFSNPFDAQTGQVVGHQITHKMWSFGQRAHQIECHF
jgi:hypothetical protein